MGKKYVKKTLKGTVSKGTVSKDNKNIKHKKMKSVGIGGSVSGRNTNNDNANNDNKQFGFVHWIARKIAELLIWLNLMNTSVKNNGNNKEHNLDMEIEFNKLPSMLEKNDLEHRPSWLRWGK